MTELCLSACLLRPEVAGQGLSASVCARTVPYLCSPRRLISNNKSGALLCSALLWCAAALSATSALLLCLFGGKECGNGGEPWKRAGGQAQAFGGGGVVVKSRTGMGETRGPERQDQGTRTAGGN